MSRDETTVAAPVTAPRTKRKRPFGVNAIIVLSVLNVLFAIGAGLVLYFDMTQFVVPVADVTVERWLLFYLIGTGVFQVFIVVGLWRLKRWGWFLVMLHNGLAMFLNIWAYFYSTPNYVTMVLAVLIVFYMNQREVQEAFIDPEAADAPGTEPKELPV